MGVSEVRFHCLEMIQDKLVKVVIHSHACPQDNLVKLYNSCKACSRPDLGVVIQVLTKVMCAIYWNVVIPHTQESGGNDYKSFH